jgi:ribosomal protein S20
MKKKNLILTLAITLTVGLGATAYAASAPVNSYCQGAGSGLGRLAGFRGFDIIESILKDKGVTDSEVTNAVNSGKTLYDLAKEKGITDDQLKKSLLEEKIKIIDDAVAKGTITKEQGDTEKERISQNIDSCTTPGQMTGRMNGQKRGRGMQNGRCLYNPSSTK